MLTKIFLIIIISISTLNANIKSSKIHFTSEELQYIKKQNKIRVALTSDYYPFSYKEKDRFEGYSIEYLNIIKKRSGLNLTFEMDTWSNNLKKFKEQKTELINGISYSAKRTSYVDFSDPYFFISNVIFTKEGSFKDYKDIGSLKGKKIGITRDIYYFDEIENLQLFDLVIFNSSIDKMKALAYGKVDAIFNNLISGQKYIEAAGYRNIKVLEEIDTDIVRKEDLRLGIQKNQPILLSIINKTINSITVLEKKRLDRKWFSVYDIENQSQKFLLTTKEQQYIDDKKTLKICIDPNWLPFEKIDKGQHIGLSSDYMKIVSNSLNTPIELVETKNWKESLNYIKNKKCDMLPLASQIQDREKFLNFSTTYINAPIVIATKTGVPFINDLESLRSKTLGISRGFSLLQQFRENYKDINFIEVNSVNEGLKKVRSSEIFGYIDNSIVINYAIQKVYIGSLSISGKLDIEHELKIATRKDEKILNDIVEKVLFSIDPVTKNRIFNKWVQIQYAVKTDYTLVYQIIIISLFLLLASFYWNRKLNYLKIKAEEATKEKSNFIANMSHEIRTPMNAIVGMTYLLKDTNFTEKQIKYLQNIQDASNDLLYIIDDILDFSKIEAGKLTIETIPLDMNHILKNLKDIIDIKINNKDINFTISNNLKYSQYIGDPVRLNQILFNLLGNAVKFTENGTIELLISEEKNDLLIFKVKDTGIGISQQDQKKLFLPFSQADDSTTRKYGGTGLGLTISKNLVEMMDGELWINSIEGEGSEFIFTIKLQKVSQNIVNIDDKYPKFNNLQEEMKKLKNFHILLVEDNEINREIVHSLLDYSGITIDDAYDGEMAYNTYITNPKKYDLILMDIQMPIKSGIEVAKLIRQTNTAIPIIALSANAMKDDEQKTKQCGMNEHLTKPIEVNKLYITLLKYLKKSHLTKQLKNNYDFTFKTIDTQIGMQYLDNNKELYYKVLNIFYKEYSQLDLSLKTDNEIMGIINSIKSISLTIGAVELHDIVTQLDKSFEKKKLVIFNNRLQQVLEELKKFTLKF